MEFIKNFNKKTFINIFVLVAVFLVGLGIGSNKIALGPDGVFRKSIQKTENNKLDYSGVEEIYSKLEEGFDGQLDGTKLEDGLKSGLVASAGDPYTEYMNASDSKDFSDQLKGTFEGIGAELGKDGQSIIIISPIDGFPAQKAGLKSKDIISKINDESAYNITISDAVKKIRGPKGTQVKLEIIRDGKAIKFDITREQINIPSVKSEITDDNIGIIKISRFGEDTVDLANKAADEFKSKNVKGVILDMRGDPGGLLDASVGVSSLWLPKGKTILEEKRDNKVIKTYTSNGKATLSGIPTIVLVDGGSASASEITTGALKDNGFATVVGTKTYGKGSVQEVRPLDDGGVLKVTIAHWFTPKGININKTGIEPDQKVEVSDDDIKANRDPQKDAALAKLR